MGNVLVEERNLAAFDLQIREPKHITDRELQRSAGEERAGGEDEEGGAGLFGEVAEAVPGGGREDPGTEFAQGDELEIEDEKGEVAVAEEEVGTGEGLGRRVAADPEEAGAGLRAVGGGVEGVRGVD